MDGSDTHDKASWSKAMLHTFCDICITAIERGMRPNTHFDKAGWKFVVQSFKDQTGLSLSKSQLKNKWDGIKKDWRVWKKLITETGVGWSTELGTISATDEWWQSKIQVSLLICNSLIIFFSCCITYSPSIIPKYIYLKLYKEKHLHQ